MYQRMLDKMNLPSPAEMEAHCGEAGSLFAWLNSWLTDTYSTERQTVFPYGNAYGWGIAHRKKGKLLCNVFPEEGAFNIMMRLNNEQWAKVYEKAQPHLQACIDQKYPCSNGGWIHYRVTNKAQLDDILYALSIRCA